MAYPGNWGQKTEVVRVRDEKCVNCQRSPDEHEGLQFETHHVVPLRWAGSNRLSNLVLLCEHCHEAAHGRRMAPRATFPTDGKMSDHEFGLFEEFWKQHDLARFDGIEKCWYVPAADMKYLVREVPAPSGTVGGRPVA